MPKREAELSYDVAENIIHMSFPEPVELRTREEITAHFDHVTAFWRAHAGGKKVYFVVDFDNVTISVAELDHYAAQSKRAHDLCAIASVRYGGNSLQRTATRLAGMKIQRASNIVDTREEAIQAVRAMKAEAKNAKKPKAEKSKG
jgi:hypothetical protein